MTLPHGTRREIMDHLVRQELAPADLAQRMGLTGAAVRQHLSTLTAEGLVERRRDETGAGRPRFLYRLSEAGRRAYPKRYDLLLEELIGTLIDHDGPEAAYDSIAEAGRRLGRRIAPSLPEGDPDRRRKAAFRWLEEALGWEGTVEAKSTGGTSIVVHRCPLQDVEPDRAAICGAFVTHLVAALLDDAEVHHVPLGEEVRCCLVNIPPAADGGSNG